mmetsp:Transcript_110924/g.312713  ORF Transcript_110924/g.312713 Transcript_110924/m.312713 type:complete len:201 (+) Transcript_110924:274-876(+)
MPGSQRRCCCRAWSRRAPPPATQMAPRALVTILTAAGLEVVLACLGTRQRMANRANRGSSTGRHPVLKGFGGGCQSRLLHLPGKSRCIFTKAAGTAHVSRLHPTHALPANWHLWTLVQRATQEGSHSHAAECDIRWLGRHELHARRNFDGFALLHEFHISMARCDRRVQGHALLRISHRSVGLATVAPSLVVLRHDVGER